MGTFNEFLERESVQLEGRKSIAATIRDEWIDSVRRLMEQIRGWLAEADPKGLLKILNRTYHLRESRIGEYDVQGLTIGFGLTEVSVEPIARQVAGSLSSTGVVHIPRAYGRIDLTDGANKYMMFRTDDRDPGDRWVIIKQEGYDLKNLDQSAFEAALQDLLE